MPKRGRSHEIEVRRIAAQEEHLRGGWAAVAEASSTALVGAMATDVWQATRSGAARLFGPRGPAGQAAIEAQLDADAALVPQAEDADEVRQGLTAMWRLELGALLGQHPQAEDELRALVVRVWEALPTPQQTWVQSNIARNQATQYTAHQVLTSRAVIDWAIGIVMAQQHCDAEAAFGILRRASQNRNVRLRELAAEIVTAVSGKTPSRALSRPVARDQMSLAGVSAAAPRQVDPGEDGAARQGDALPRPELA